MVLKKKKGSVVILLAISSALVIGVSLGVFKMIHSSQNYQFVKNSFTKYQLLASSLKTLISNPSYCTSILKDQDYLYTLNKNEMQISLSYFNVRKFVPEMTARYVLIPDNSITLFYPDIMMSNESANEGVTLYRYKAYLEIWVVVDTGENEIGFNYRRLGGCDSANASDCDTDMTKLNFSIPLYINVDGSAKVKSCYGVNTQAYVCEVRGGAWNPDESELDKRCNPDKICRSYLPDLAQNCPDPSIKIVAGVDNLAGHSDVSAMGQVVIDLVRQTIIDAFNSRLGIATADTTNSVSGEVTQINAEKWQAYQVYQNCRLSYLSALNSYNSCRLAYNQAMASYNSCLSSPPPPPATCGSAPSYTCGSQPVYTCGPVVTYDPLDANAVASEAIGQTATLGAAIADGIMEEMDPKPEAVKVGEIIYDGFLQGSPPEDIGKSLIDKMDFHVDDLQSVYQQVIDDHVNDNITSGGSAGTYGNRIHGAATSAINTHVDIPAVKAEIDQKSEQKINAYVSSLASQREKIMCEWCNTYRYPP